MFTSVNYDVDAPEGAKTGSAYISKKDWRWIIGVILFVLIIGVPLWWGFMQQRDKQVCATNMKGIYEAMMLYAADNNDMLPPLYHVGPAGAPMLDAKKRPLVWASLLAKYKNDRAQFFCPAAEDDEKMPAIGDDDETIQLTYGMFVAMGTNPYMLLAKPDDTALIVETSNNGSQGSYNPFPFRDPSGSVVPFDAFMVGYDDSNGAMTAESKAVTRLAIRGVANGYRSKDATPRHGLGIHVFYVNGSKGFLKAPSGELRNIFPDAEGPWRTK